MATVDDLKIKLRKREEEIVKEIKAIEPINGCYPVFDGIIDIDRYITSKYKILWILKEANYGKSDKSWDMLDYYRKATETEIRNSPTTKRVLQVSHRILSNSSPLEDFQSIAYINIKKVAGYDKSVDEEMQNAYDKNKDLLITQIDTYQPDIIIGGSTLHYFAKDLPFRELQPMPMDNMSGYNYFCGKDRLYISAYHPAYPKITDKKYCDSIYAAFFDWKSRKE
ncbi:hypothetical protein [Treponema endosymbiont of Eucomonympha sp.]|uniref:hypothetical protein n=1 Tax=Treponema endosymbiont of Eucomonympha sp. TaxID=1580831 RepID=UPI000A790F88|nr:hypothetical protein [Treponema endosymbiont of Eucomonympha sp.]